LTTKPQRRQSWSRASAEEEQEEAQEEAASAALVPPVVEVVMAVQRATTKPQDAPTAVAVAAAAAEEEEEEEAALAKAAVVVVVAAAAVAAATTVVAPGAVRALAAPMRVAPVARTFHAAAVDTQFARQETTPEPPLHHPFRYPPRAAAPRQIVMALAATAPRTRTVRSCGAWPPQRGRPHGRATTPRRPSALRGGPARELDSHVNIWLNECRKRNARARARTSV
jgi:hypothetical protein